MMTPWYTLPRNSPAHLHYQYWPMLPLSYLQYSLAGSSGLGLPQSLELLAHSEAGKNLTRLDNNSLLIIHQLKQLKVDEFSEVFPDLFQIEYCKLTPSKCAWYLMVGSTYRTQLMDIIVLTLAECNRCHVRADFDAELHGILGDAFDATWRSRFYNSVCYTLRANDIPCFKQKKKKNKKKKKQKSGSNIEIKLSVVGPMYTKTLF